MEAWARYDHHAIAEYQATLEQVRTDLVAWGHILDGKNQSSLRLEALLNSVPLFSNGDDPLFEEWTQPLSIPYHDFDIALDPPDEAASTLLRDLYDDNNASLDPRHLSEDALMSLSRSVLNLKLELPLLESNPELDFRRFLAEFSAESRPNPVHTSILPCEPVDDHEDAGLQFPASSEAFRRRLDDELRHEVLDYTEEHLVLVAEIQYTDPTSIDMSSFLLNELDQLAQRQVRLRRHCIWILQLFPVVCSYVYRIDQGLLHLLCFQSPTAPNLSFPPSQTPIYRFFLILLLSWMKTWRKSWATSGTTTYNYREKRLSYLQAAHPSPSTFP